MLEVKVDDMEQEVANEPNKKKKKATSVWGVSNGFTFDLLQGVLKTSNKHLRFVFLARMIRLALFNLTLPCVPTKINILQSGTCIARVWILIARRGK